MLKNSFAPIYDRLNAGTSKERYAARPDFPLLLDVELTNNCNFSCRMCETGMRTSPRRRGYMQRHLFKKILDECTAHNTALRFIRWGEPTLHPHWLDWMQQAKSRGLCVHFNTNGSLLDEMHMRALVSSGIDSVKFSFQGVDRDSYQEMRAVDYFEPLMQRIGQLKTIRGSSVTPWIQISTTITNESQAAVVVFQKRAKAVADYVNVGVTKIEEVDATKLSPEAKIIQESLLARQAVLRRPSACAEVFAKLSVDWDGTVTACCADNRGEMTVGHLDTDSLSDIWNGEPQRTYQKALAGNNFEISSLCRRCYTSIDVDESCL